MDQSEQIKRLIGYIGKEKFQELEAQIPEKYKAEININFSEFLLKQTEQKILDFYGGLINDNNQWTTTKLCGSTIILTSHVHDLLKKLVERKETEQELINNLLKFELHYLILYCVEKYNIPKDYFIQMMELKHFRNMIGHNFNGVLETGFNEAIHPICKGHLLVIVLTGMIRNCNL